jgi:endonuclease YncB( thermonuclease family)
MLLLTIRRQRAVIIALLCSLLLLTAWPPHAVAQVAPQPATVLRNANLRTGPGTTYARAGSVPAGATVQIVGQTVAGDWYELDGGAWIAAFLVRVDAAVTSAPPAGAAPAQVVSITDGDTIRVRLNGAEASTRCATSSSTRPKPMKHLAPTPPPPTAAWSKARPSTCSRM